MHARHEHGTRPPCWEIPLRSHSSSLRYEPPGYGSKPARLPLSWKENGRPSLLLGLRPAILVVGLSSKFCCLKSSGRSNNQSTHRGMNYRKLTTKRSVHASFSRRWQARSLEPACHIAAKAAGSYVSRIRPVQEYGNAWRQDAKRRFIKRKSQNTQV